jgi:hypothetical protein
MKMKLAVAFAVLFFATLAHADSQQITVDISGTNCGCGILGPTTPISYSAQLTVEPVFGTWFFAGQAFFFTGSVDEVIALTGEVNGFPMTLSQAPLGDGSWIQTADGGPGVAGDAPYSLGTIYFTVDGIPSLLMQDGVSFIEGFGGSDAVSYVAVAASNNVPEPSSLLLSVIGLALFCLFAKLKIHAPNN